MNLYSSIPDTWHYAFHLLVWMLPVLLLQWAVGLRILLANWKPVVFTPLLLGTYLIFTDMAAVRFGVWHFDEEQILGISPGGVPIEEWAFFYLTTLLVVQGFLLFLPEKYRHPVRRSE